MKRVKNILIVVLIILTIFTAIFYGFMLWLLTDEVKFASSYTETRRNEGLTGKYPHGDMYIVRVKYPDE